MKKFILITVALFSCANIVFADTPAPDKKPKTKFDWNKAQGDRQKMREKFRAEHKIYVEKLKEFHKRHEQAKTQQAKDAVRAELHKFLTEDFQRKIQFSKKRIENLKKYVSHLEEEQKKFEQKSDEIINKRTENILKGKILPPRRKR